MQHWLTRASYLTHGRLTPLLAGHISIRGEFQLIKMVFHETERLMNLPITRACLYIGPAGAHSSAPRARAVTGILSKSRLVGSQEVKGGGRTPRRCRWHHHRNRLSRARSRPRPRSAKAELSGIATATAKSKRTCHPRFASVAVCTSSLHHCSQHSPRASSRRN